MTRQFFLALAATLTLMSSLLAASGPAWSEPVEVRHDSKLVLSYQAAWDGDYLVVRATIQPGWHTFVMDNKQRQDEKLAGKPSLGVEKSTEIKVTGGLEKTGPWLQAQPKDFSKPELRWYSWGYEGTATFAAKVRKVDGSTATAEVTGQACRDEICKNIEITLQVPLGAKTDSATLVDPSALIPVR